MSDELRRLATEARDEARTRGYLDDDFPAIRGFVLAARPAAILELLDDRDRLREALVAIRDLAEDELRRLGAVPGSNVSQIEAEATAALEQYERTVKWDKEQTSHLRERLGGEEERYERR